MKGIKQSGRAHMLRPQLQIHRQALCLCCPDVLTQRVEHFTVLRCTDKLPSCLSLEICQCLCAPVPICNHESEHSIMLRFVAHRSFVWKVGPAAHSHDDLAAVTSSGTSLDKQSSAMHLQHLTLCDASHLRFV